MRVYAEVLPSSLGRAMYRINGELKRYAPAGVEFVKDPKQADLQILDVIGSGSLEYRRCNRLVILQHCYLTTENPTADYWLPVFQDAELVASYHDLPGLTGSSKFNFLRMPWGVDGNVFRPQPVTRDTFVMTSGYCDQGEVLQEFYLAAQVAGGVVFHLGPRFAWARHNWYQAEGISESELIRWYSRCYWVSGLRRGEGFELPVLEGLACGARPICFDTPGYRFWFSDHAVFVPEVSRAELVPILTEVLSQPPELVSELERQVILDTFSWERIFKNFWQRVMG